ncbi:glycine betaine/proline transport system substrate-binding protein [Leifsonia sp. AK011]|uniref:glycine betaine ABC transporter substrate-binding protein n=1 Tax=Leifsonia sp. AK011 TaxID=2723075 RepID=UPI0015C8DBB5|nr:glycine betaine ABC transporter substrate-binding protein [Leifsonia sp. AK011]NYF10274.1 glycine betaine/proline transport system substrate-binding protein [Leifsonia sp. AK011]
MKKSTTAIFAVTAATALALSGCAPQDTNDAGGDGTAPTAITLAVFNGWDEGIATSELWKAVLESKGYDVSLEYADVAPLFAGLSTGDYDFTTDVWLPGTHAAYVEEFGDEIVDLGAWNDESKLTVAVNADAPIDSLSELAANADLFGDQIVGIEPGAGLTAAMENEVIPGYGLTDMTFTTSSTAAMLTELKAATDAGENVVVTLWEPHWAYGAFPIKNLEDPEGALGGTESLHSFSRVGFSDDFPEVAAWLSDFEMDLEQLYSLENVLFVENDTDDLGPLVEQWIADNQEYVDSLTS